MQNIRLKNKVFIYFYGLPGSGKTHIARQLSKDLGLAHISSDRLRHELFDKPNYDNTERRILTNLMSYMAEQFLNAGAGVLYDISANRITERRMLRELAKGHKASQLLIWVQIDADTAYKRIETKDHRRSEDKYSAKISKEKFDEYMKLMQNPTDENYLVLSGKHAFSTQKNSIIRRLHDMGLIDDTEIKLAKPELINLVSRAQAQAGRVDLSRRNVIIR